MTPFSLFTHGLASPPEPSASAVFLTVLAAAALRMAAARTAASLRDTFGLIRLTAGHPRASERAR